MKCLQTGKKELLWYFAAFDLSLSATRLNAKQSFSSFFRSYISLSKSFQQLPFFSVDLNKEWHRFFQRAFHFAFHHTVFLNISISYAKVSCWRLSYSTLAVLPLKSISFPSDSLSTFIPCCVQQLTAASLYVKHSELFCMAYFSLELSLLETLHVISVYLTLFLLHWFF